MNKDEKNKIRKLVKDLEKEANPDRPRDMEDEKMNDFSTMLNSLPDTKSKIKLLRNVLKEMENVRLDKIKREYPAKSLASGKQPIKVWKERIKQALKEYSLYKRIERMIKELKENPKKTFPQTFKTFEAATKSLEEYGKTYRIIQIEEWKNNLLFDIIEIKNYLNSLKTNNEKIEFLKCQLHELNQICYHYTDDNIETLLKKYKIDTKFPREEYSPWADYEHSHISHSEFSGFLRLLNENIIPFVNSEIRTLEPYIKSEVNDLKNNKTNDELQKFPFLWKWEDVKKYADNLFDKKDKINFYVELIKEIGSFGNNRLDRLRLIDLFIKKNRLESLFQKETIKDIVTKTEINGYFDFLRTINRNSGSAEKEIKNLNTSIDEFIAVEKLLNRNAFLKYKNELSCGYYDDNFIRDLECIVKIEDKIIFLNYISSQIDEEIENIQLSLDLVEIKIEKYNENKYPEPLQDILNKKAGYDECIGLYEDSKRFISEKIEFWNEQLEIKRGKTKPIDENLKTESSKINTSEKDVTKYAKIKSIQWLGTQEQLENLFILLKENDYLIFDDRDIETYLANFIDSKGDKFTDKKAVQIKWFGTQRELTYLLSELTKGDINLLSEDEIWKKTNKILINKDGKQFKSLSVSSQHTPKNQHSITKIIKLVQKS